MSAKFLKVFQTPQNLNTRCPGDPKYYCFLYYYSINLAEILVPYQYLRGGFRKWECHTGDVIMILWLICEHSIILVVSGNDKMILSFKFIEPKSFFSLFFLFFLSLFFFFLI